MPDIQNYEKPLLGAMLQSKEAIGDALQIVGKDYFETDLHQKIFLQIVKIYDLDEPLELSNFDGEKSYLLDLIDEAPSPANASYYAEKVRDQYIRRELNQTCQSVLNNKMDDLDTLLDEFESKVFQLAENKITGETSKLEDINPQVYEKIIDGSSTEGLKTDFYDLAEIVGSISGYWIIAGRPSIGKTAFALSLMLNWASRGIPCAIFSLESTKQAIARRLLSMETGISTLKFRTGKLSIFEMDALKSAVEKMCPYPLFIDDSASLNTIQLKAKARRVVSRYHPKVIVIDYLQLLNTKHRCNSRNDEITEISRTIGSLTKQLNIPIVALSQLSRKVEDREDKRPQLADLRESGSIEQDADTVVFIHRPEYYRKEKFKDGTPSGNLAEIIVAKQRDGAQGNFKMTFLKECTRFENYQKE